VSEVAESLMLGCRFVLAFVLLSSSIPKLAAPAEFARAVRNYRLVPARVNREVAAWLPRLELALALTLLFGVVVRLAAAMAALAFVGFAVAVSINLARGRRIDCGCYSSVSPRAIGWVLVVRNLLLALLAVCLVLLPPGALSVTALWSSQSAPLAVSDGVAVALIAAAVVVAQLLLDEVIRVRRAVASVGRRAGLPS
jgi:uncharacterized membrane protein YphA (DoxX/SURF4 family)